MKRLASILIALTFILGILTGCNSTASTSATTGTAKSTSAAATTAQTTAAQKVIKVTIACYTQNGGAIPDKNSDVVKYLNDKFKFEIECVGELDITNYNQKMNMLLASNTLPDLFAVNSNTALIQQGCAEITTSDMQQYFTKTYAQINQLSESIGRNPEILWNIFKNNGKIMQIPTAWYGGKFADKPVLWRQDVLDELGMKVPSTVAQWEDVFKAYKAKYPDRYAYTGCMKNLAWQTFTAVTGAAGVSFWQWQVKGDKIIAGWVQPEIKPVLEVLNKWYKAGYLDKEFPTKDQAGKNNDFINGKSIVTDWSGGVSAITEKPYEVGSMEEKTVAVIPGATFAAGPFATMTEGGKAAWQVWDPFTGGSVGFGKQLDADKDKMHRVMQFLDALNADKNVFLTAYMGFEGKHWDYAADGHAQSKAEFATGESRSALGTGGNFWLNLCSNSEFNRDEITKSKRLLDTRAKLTGPGGTQGPEKIIPVIDALKVGIKTDDGTNLLTKYEDLFTKRNTMFVEIITGAKPISYFDEYVKMWNEKGGKELEEVANKNNMKFWK